jgi:hypothetical protein
MKKSPWSSLDEYMLARKMRQGGGEQTAMTTENAPALTPHEM